MQNRTISCIGDRTRPYGVMDHAPKKIERRLMSVEVTAFSFVKQDTFSHQRMKDYFGTPQHFFAIATPTGAAIRAMI